MAPNRFVLDWVKEHHLELISNVLRQSFPERPLEVTLDIGSSQRRLARLADKPNRKPLLVEVPEDTTSTAPI